MQYDPREPSHPPDDLFEILDGPHGETLIKRFLLLAAQLVPPHPYKEKIDYVYEALRTLLSDERKWPADVSLSTTVYYVIWSLVSRDHKVAMEATVNVSIESEARTVVAVLADPAERFDSVVEANDLAAQFIAAHEEYRPYLELRLALPDETAAFYALMLDVEIQQIRNWDRAIRRRRGEWLGK